MAEPTDREIKELIKRHLKDDPRIDLSEININVEGGVIYLSGMVDGAAERLAVQEDIEAVIKSPHVVDQIQLANYVQRSDDELRQTVKHSLLRDIMVDAAPISVDARDGVVTLSGIVSSYSQKTTAESIALWTPGVIKVINRIDVDGLAEPSDEY